MRDLTEALNKRIIKKSMLEAFGFKKMVEHMSIESLLLMESLRSTYTYLTTKIALKLWMWRMNLNMH